MFRSIVPQRSPDELQPHAHRLTLRGAPGDLRFPPICASCGGPPAAAIRVTKVFRRDDDDRPAQHTVTSAAVPFCSACIVDHRANVVLPTLADKLRLSFADMHILGAVFPALGALFVFHLALGDAVHGRGMRALVESGLGAFFAFLAWAQAWALWRRHEDLRVPPQTAVTRAFDFSDDVSSLFERARFVCTMRDQRFAEAFGRLNADREYRAESAAARAERRWTSVLTWLLAAVVTAAGAWALWDDWFA